MTIGECASHAEVLAAVGLSVAGSPVLLHSGDGLVFAHRCHFGFAEADSREKQVDEIGRKRFWGWLGCAAVRHFPVLDACPERCLIDFELVSEDMAPEVLAVGIPVHPGRKPAFSRSARDEPGFRS